MQTGSQPAHSRLSSNWIAGAADRGYRICLKAVAGKYRNRGGRGDGEIP